MTWVAYLVAAAIIAAAAWILWKRISAFLKSGGQSGCENCPYSGGCSRQSECPKKRL